jgi:nicotine blue oxidoreductase
MRHPAAVSQPLRTGPVGLVLAAGEGKRLSRPKALVEIGGRRLVDRAVDSLVAGGCHPVLVVSGATPLEVPGATVVHNPRWPDGMGSSLRVGLAALPAAAPAVVVMLVDTPGVDARVISRLIAAWLEGAQVTVATYAGARRTPVLLGSAHWAEAAARAEGDYGARAFLTAHPELVTEVECGDLGPWRDLDTPVDLARWRDELHDHAGIGDGLHDHAGDERGILPP